MSSVTGTNVLLFLLISCMTCTALKFPCETNCFAGESSCVSANQPCVAHSPRAYDQGSAYEYGRPGVTGPSFDRQDPCGALDDVRNRRTTCPICDVTGHICHNQRCLELTQNLGDICCTTSSGCLDSYVNKYCKEGLFCEVVSLSNDTGVCTQVQYSLQLGEACDAATQVCAGGNVCTNNKCEVRFPGACYQDSECEFGQYCKLNNITGQENRCVSTQHAEGQDCDIEQVALVRGMQCGHILTCVQDGLESYKCKKKFSLPYGAACSDSNQCQKGLFCFDAPAGSFCERVTPQEKRKEDSNCCGRDASWTCPPPSWGEPTEMKCQYTDEIQGFLIAPSQYSNYESKIYQCFMDQRCQSPDGDSKCLKECIDANLKSLEGILGNCMKSDRSLYVFNSAVSTKASVFVWSVLAAGILALSFH